MAKLSLVGAGMVNASGVAADMFEALYQSRVNIHMISTSEVKISVLIDKADSEKALPSLKGVQSILSSTATPNPNVTPTPGPTPEEPTWSYPSASAGAPIEPLPEDNWARS